MVLFFGVIELFEACKLLADLLRRVEIRQERLVLLAKSS